MTFENRHQRRKMAKLGRVEARKVAKAEYERYRKCNPLVLYPWQKAKQDAPTNPELPVSDAAPSEG